MRIEAKKDSMRQTQDGTWKLGFTVKPEDMPVELMTAQMGTIYTITIVDAENEAYEATYDEVEFKKPFKELPLSQQAVLICKRENFQSFARNDWIPSGLPPGKDLEWLAIQLIYAVCGITSRSELTTNKDAADKYRELIKKFEGWQVENRYKENLQRI